MDYKTLYFQTKAKYFELSQNIKRGGLLKKCSSADCSDNVVQGKKFCSEHLQKMIIKN